MKAALYRNLEDIRLVEMPKPKIGADEALVHMKACGICGSDLMDWYLQSRVPLVLGHEPAGIIAETGKDVKGFEVGDRVFVHHHVADLTCHYCVKGDYTVCPQFGQTHLDPGGFAEYFRVAAPNLQIDTLKLPSNLSFEEATLIEPIGCCIRAQDKVGIKKGDSVAIIGAGPSGMIHAMLARISGAAKVIAADVVEYRLKLAERLGVDVTVNPREHDTIKAVREATEGRGADVLIVTVPNVKVIEDSVQSVRRGGRVLLFAPAQPDQYAKLSPFRLFFSEISIISSYSTSHVETRLALQLIGSGKIDAKALITHRFPLSQISEAFQTAAKTKDCLKVVVLNE